jgi:hypothetical protein
VEICRMNETHVPPHRGMMSTVTAPRISLGQGPRQRQVNKEGTALLPKCEPWKSDLMVTPLSIDLVSYRSGCPLSVVFDGRQPDGWSVYSAQQCERRLVPLDQSTVPVWRYKDASVLIPEPSRVASK